MARIKRTVRKRMHILCEGKKTEPYYLRGYILHHAHDKADVIEVPDTKYNTAIALVDEAIRLKESSETSDEDEFWVVYDREGVSKYSNELHATAREKARNNNIKIAFSNVCFEIWLLLHFDYRNAPYTCCDELLRVSPLKSDLQSIGINSYSKGDPHLFSKIHGGVDNARARAKALNRENLSTAPSDRTQPHELSVYTDIYLLLDAIDSFEA